MVTIFRTFSARVKLSGAILFCLTNLLPFQAVAEFRYVSTNSVPQEPYTNWADAASSIQTAINVANPGDTVLVSNGVYNTGTVSLFGMIASRIAIQNGITVKSVNGPQYTFILGQGPMGTNAVRCVYVNHANAQLIGFTLQGGYTEDNSDPDRGAGAGAICEAGLILNCIFEGNQANSGAGAYLSGAGAARNCVFTNNQATTKGGGVFCDSGGIVESCTIRNNTGLSGEGGGLFLNNGGTVTNTISYFNTTGGNWSRAGASDIWGYSCTTPTPTGEGIITNDPKFAASNDFRLHWLSPCVDTGANQAWMTGSADVDGRDRITNGVVDIGAFELPIYTIAASAGTNGVIAPTGVVLVAYGAGTNFVMTPGANYHVDDVLVNGSSVGSSANYTFSDVKSNQTIYASFAIDTYNLVVASPYGAVVPPVGTNTYAYNTNVTAEVTNSPVINGGTNYQCVGWTGSGSAPASGSNTSLTITITSASGLTWLWITNYSLNIAALNGYTTPGPGWYAAGTNLTITAVSNTGYHFVDWTGDAATTNNPLSLTLTDPLSITANFEINTYSITASSDTNGTISPSNIVTVIHGASTNFVMTPNASNHVQDVLIDGVSIGPTNSYTFDNVTNNNRTIDVKFTNTYSLVVSNEQAGGGPWPAVGNNIFTEGTNIQLIMSSTDLFNADTNSNYSCIGWVGSGSVPASGTNTSVNVTITNYSSISWLWRTNYLLKVAAGANGTVDVTNQQWLTSGTNITLTAMPTSNYHFVDWTTNAVTVATNNPFNLTMDRPYDLTANFAINTFTITATATTYGTISPNGAVTVTYGDSANFVLFPAANSHVEDVIVDGGSIGATNSYTFSNVATDHTIVAQFAIDTFTITATATGYGTITPSGAVVVAYNNETNFLIEAAGADYHITSIATNSVTTVYTDNDFQSINYSWSGVTSNGTMAVTFDIDRYNLVVASPYGTAAPPVGANSYPVGSTVDCAVVNSPVNAGALATQYVCVGWTGTGSAPDSGAQTNVTVIITNDSTLTWLWITNYYLSISKVGNGSADVTSGWYNAGTTNVITATAAIGSTFSGWTGDRVSPNEVIAVTNDMPRSLLANFTPKTYYVSPNGAHQNPHTNWVMAATNIQTALGIAGNGERVMVTDGVYVISSQLASTNGVIIQSVNGPEYTIARAMRSSRCFLLSHSNDTLNGFTITGGRADEGGGVKCEAAATVRNCVIAANSANNGGGAHLASGAVLENCVLTANSATKGGGAYWLSGGTLLNCTVVANSATERGGGAEGLLGGTVQNSVIYSNSAAGLGANFYPESFLGTASYNCTTPALGGTDITNPPQMTVAYRSKSNSPGIDAGTSAGAPSADIDGESRWDHPGHANIVSTVDIGADEFGDADGDEMADVWETRRFGSTNISPTADNDSDSINNLTEYYNDTQPADSDSDNDSLNDGWELLYGFDPLSPSGGLWGAAATEMDSYDTAGNAYGVFVAGNYAYVADDANGLRIIDVSNPASITEVGGYDTSGNANGVYVTNGYAYIADGASGLQIVNVAVPTSPVAAGGTNTAGDARGVFVSGSRVYLAAGNSGLQIIDVSDPTNAVLTNTFDTAGVANKVFVVGDTAYLADDNGGLRIIDVSDPTNAVPLGNYGTPGLARGVVVKGTYAYVADSARGLQVVDVSAPGSSALVGECYVVDAWGVDVSGGNAYMAGAWGLDVIDASNTGQYFHAGGFATADDARGVFVVGNLAYVASRTGGLHVVEILTRDTDQDGMSDVWETNRWGNLIQTGAGDSDSDGIINVGEYLAGLNPTNADSDGDALNDGLEVNTHYTDPSDWDTDNDGFGDGWEVSAPYTVPTNAASFPAVISGTITYNGAQAGLIGIIVSNTIFSTAVSNEAPGAYSVTNLPTLTNYWVSAYRDSNSNGVKDSWEASGNYSGNPLSLAGNSGGINITLTDPMFQFNVLGSPGQYGSPTPYGYGTASITSATVIAESVVSPAMDGTTQYVCLGWDGTGSVPATGAGANVTITITNDSSLTWNWRVDYFLDTAAGANGSVDVGDGWYSNGAPVTINATLNEHYHFVNWIGTITSTDNPLTLTMNQPYSVVANFAIDTYNITAAAGPNGSITPSGAVSVPWNGTTNFTMTPNANYHLLDVEIDSISIGPTSTYSFINVTNNRSISVFFAIDTYTLSVATPYGIAVPSGINTYDYGASVPCAVTNSPVIVGGTQYLCRGWIGTGSAPGSGTGTNATVTVTANSTLTWQWTTNYYLDSTVSGNGSVNVADGWYAIGTNVTITATPGEGRHFVQWSGDVSSTNNPLALTMSRAYAVTAEFAINMYNITATAGLNGAISPSGVVQIAHGGSTNFAITPDANYYVADVKIDDVSIGSVGAYNFLNVTNARAIAATFDNTHQLVVATPPYGAAAPSGANTYTYGTGVSCAITNSPVTAGGTQYVASGWIGTGSVAPAGSGTNVLVTITTNSTLAWQWATNYWGEWQVAGGVGQVDQSSGWHAIGTNVTITATPSNGYHFVGWTGGITASNNPLVVTMSQAYAVAADFAINMYDIAATAGVNGVISPSGVVQVAHGGNTNFVITPNTNYFILDVTVDGVSVGASNAYTFAGVTNGHSIYATFGTNQYELVVQTAWGTATPPAGTNVITFGSVTSSITDSPVIVGTTQYVCSGWIGTGSAPSSGLSTNFEMVIEQNSTVTWRWDTNYYLNTVAGSNGNVNVASGWFLGGTNISITATPDNYFHFVDWTGDVAATDNPLVLTNLTRPYSVTANFATNMFTITAVAGPNGAIAPSGALEVALMATTNFLITPDPNHHIQQLGVDGFPMAVTNNYTFSDIATNHTIDVSFAIDTHELVVTTPFGTAAPTGNNTFDYGSNIYCEVRGSPIQIGGTQYVGVGWTGTGSAPSNGVATNFNVVITTNSTLTWVWTTNYYLDINAGSNGSVDATDGWLLTGTNISITAAPQTGYHFGGWTGNISTNLTNSNPLSLAMGQPYSVAASFPIDTHTFVVSTPYGAVAPSGTNIYDYGTTVTAVVSNSPVTDGGTQYVCTGWVGTGSVAATGTATNVTITITNNSTLAWQWTTNYYFSATAGGNGSVIATASNGWLAYGASVTVTAAPQIGHHFGGWTGNISTNLTNSSQLILTMDRPYSVAASFAIDTHTLVVSTAYGTVVPSATNTYDYGTTVTAVVVNSPFTVGTTQYVCAGWIGTGSVAATGTATNVTITITNNSTLAWQWTTNYYFNATAGSNGSVAATASNGWLALGTSVTVTATAVTGYHFTVWTGNAPTGSTNNNPLFLAMTRPYSVTANFDVNKYYVSPNGEHVWPFTNWTTASRNIQEAVAAATENTVVLVTNGTYTLSGEVFLTNGITIKGVNGSTNTIIDGNNSVRCFYLANSNAVLDGLTIRRGRTADNGAGVYCTAGTIRNCAIANNFAGNYGGGVYLYTGGKVENSVISSNESLYGGGAQCTITGELRNCVISSNRAAYGGGARIRDGGYIKDCVITANTAWVSGGGVEIVYTGVVDNCAIVGNAATDYNMITNYGGGAHCYAGGLVTNCVIRGNASEDYGGGVQCSITGDVRNCTIGGNMARYGGGLRLKDGGYARDCVITGNTAWISGGGVQIVYTGVVDNCQISRNAATNYGGGVYCLEGGLVTNSVISSNTGVYGGGVHCTSNGTARNCVIARNEALYGGGVRCRYGGEIQSCVITANTATVSGGGAQLVGTGVIENCQISDNGAKDGGGGIWLFQGGVVRNCTVSWNLATNSAGGLSCTNGGNILNTIIYLNWNTTMGVASNWYNEGGNITYAYDCTIPSVSGEGNITNNPMFVNASARDFHLQSNSPCIDAGTSNGAPARDFAGIARPLDGNADGLVRYDMGVYEFYSDAGDSDGDSIGDAEEIGAGADGYVTDPLKADTDGDGVNDPTELDLSRNPANSADGGALSSIGGRVTGNGVGVPQAGVEFRGKTNTYHWAVSDTNGAYSVSNVVSGAYYIKAGADGYAHEWHNNADHRDSAAAYMTPTGSVITNLDFDLRTDIRSPARANVLSTPTGATVYLDYQATTNKTQALVDIGRGATQGITIASSTFLRGVASNDAVTLFVAMSGYPYPTPQSVVPIQAETLASNIQFDLVGTQSGAVSVATTPAGADVFIDRADVSAGVSPVIVSNLLAGSHTILLKKDGYLLPRPIAATVQTGATTSINAPLTAVGAGTNFSVEIRSDPTGLPVYVDYFATTNVTDVVIDWLDAASHAGAGWRSEWHSIMLRKDGRYVLFALEPVSANDYDSDGLPNWHEDQYVFLNPWNPSDATNDWDNDFLSNLGEYQNGTSPTNSDTDADSLKDGWETGNGFNPTNVRSAFAAELYLRGAYDTPGCAEAVYVASNVAYVADGSNGLLVIDVSDATNLVALGAYDTPGYAEAAHVVSNMVYVADGVGGLHVLDAGVPTNPVLRGAYSTSGYVSDVYVITNIAYLADGTGGVWVIDASDPTNLVFLGAHDTPGDASGIYVVSNMAYLADGSNGLLVIDVSDATNLVALGAYDTPGCAEAVYVASNVAYVADGSNGLLTIDVSAPTNLVALGARDTPGYAWAVCVVSNKAYVADGSNGLRIIDVSDATNLVVLGAHDTPGDARGIYVASNMVYVADGTGGLRVVEALFVDADRDGLPDSWETNWFGNWEQAGTNDYDGDGIINWGEYLTGLNPTNADTDMDGINDGFEANYYNIDPFDADSDDDGLDDGEERIAGTSPSDSGAYFMVDDVGVATGGVFVVEWQTFTGRLYTLKSATNLIVGAWTNVPGWVDVPGTNGAISSTNAASEPNLFYRIEVRLSGE